MNRFDAIVQATRRPRRWWEKLLRRRGEPDDSLFRPATPFERLVRYQNAARQFPLSLSFIEACQREVRGIVLRDHWRRGIFPRSNPQKKPLHRPLLMRVK